MTTPAHCPHCQSEHSYQDRDLWICAMCAHEWPINETTQLDPQERIVKDANGNVLHDGDSVTVIKDLKVKGTSTVVKVGTKVKNIRLVDADHDIDCKIDGIGQMGLKSQYVKKIT